MRRDFLRVAGAGAAGAILLGGPSCGSGTEESKAKETSVEETSVKKTDAKAPNTKRMNVILVILDSLKRPRRRLRQRSDEHADPGCPGHGGFALQPRPPGGDAHHPG
jgi:hypothetical protein